MRAGAVGVVAVLWRQGPEELGRFAQGLARLYPGPAGVWVALNDAGRELPPCFAESGLSAWGVPTGGNLGWTGGVNAAARAALGAGVEGLMIMNTDVDIPRPDLLARLGEALEADPALGAVSPAITLGRGGADTGLVWYRGAKVWRRAVATRHPGMGRPASCSGSVVPTGMPSGCAMLVRREAWEACGGLDEALFAYFDEAEWAMRAKRAGWGVALVDLPMVVHHTAEGWGEPTAWLFGRNPVLVAKKHLGPGGVAATVALQAALSVLYWRRAGGRGPRCAYWRGLWAGMRSPAP